MLAFSPILRDGEEAKWGMGRLHQPKSNVLMLLKARNAGLRYRGFCCSADVANNNADFDSCGGSPEQVGTLSMNIRA